MTDKDGDFENKVKMIVAQVKDAYDRAFAGNDVILQDLRSFCSLDVPTDPNGKDLDVNKVMVMTGRASVFGRIEYWLNTPVEQLQRDMINKLKNRS